MKRSTLRRGKPLSPGTKGLKRTPIKRPTLPDSAEAHAWSTVPRENKRRKAKRRERDFGPHGDYIIPTLPCAVACKAWWSKVDDETLVAMMERALDEPERYAHVSEPAHVTHSRGAGGHASALVPLGAALHAEQHAIGVRSFAEKHGVDLPALAARLWRLSPARILMEERGL